MDHYQAGHELDPYTQLAYSTTGFCADIPPIRGGRQNIHETSQRFKNARKMQSQNTCTDAFKNYLCFKTSMQRMEHRHRQDTGKARLSTIKSGSLPILP